MQVKKLAEVINFAEKTNDFVNSIVWGPLMLSLVMLVGLLFSVRLRFFQVSRCKLWLRHTFGNFFSHKSNDKKGSITPFQAVSTALASAVGTGNIVGVATAITLGGAGAVFWMWLAAIFGMMTSFAENVLGVKYRKVNANGQNYGGPMYYIENGLGVRWLARFFAVACILASFGIGNMAQVNSIAASVKSSFRIPPAITGVVLAVIISFIIFGGIRTISRVSERIVPFMALFYIVGGLVVIITHIQNLPGAIFSIFSGAFDFRSVTGGITGFVAASAIKHGIARGVFSNEAGLGSSPIVHAASSECEPVIQGMWGIFQVFVDTILICSVTALCILTSGVLPTAQDGALLSVQAFSTTFGGAGEIFVTISITLFAFATVIGWSYYGEQCIGYLSGEHFSRNVLIYKALQVLFILFAAVMKIDLVWSISDTFNGLMALPNLIALLFLSGQVVKEYRRYLRDN